MPIRLRAIDRHFARFCRTGDARALGSVFDRTARELLHLAGWLGGSRSDAEDLLQQTFLTAIEQRSAFAGQRRVLPWLVTILGNHARNLRRERARRAALPGRPEPVADPVAAAADAEFAAWLAGARAGIGPPYSELLELHLEHGLNAKEIGARLDRPAGTVRTQLVRALELLRRRLPSGFTAALAPWLPEAEAAAVTKVKVVVLAAARPAAPVAATATSSAAVGVVAAMAGGALVGKRIAVFSSLLVAFAGVLGAVLWFGSHGGVAPAAADGVASPVSAAVADAGAHAEPSVKVDRQEVPSAATGSRAALPSADFALRFTGRCVAAEDGAPLAGVAVTFAPTAKLSAEAPLAVMRGEDRDPVTVHTQTDAAGRFEVVGERAPGWQQRLSFEAPGRICLEGYCYMRGQEVDLGDVRLSRGVAAAARVVDAAGRPQPRRQVGLNGPAGMEAQVSAIGWLRPQTWVHVCSRDDGTLPLPAAMPPGRWSVGCTDREIVGANSGNIPWDVVAGGPPLDIVIDPDPESITGVVTDAFGAPLQDVAVEPLQRQNGWGIVANTDAAGRFRVCRWSTDRPDPHRLDLTRPGYRSLRTEPIAWGAGELRFVLQPARALELLVVDADTEAPVEQFAVRVLWNHQQTHGDGRIANGGLQQAGHHAGGHARLLLDDGAHRLCVQPFDGRHAPSEPVALDVSDALPRQLVVRVPATEARTVQLVTASGAPVAGSRVELWRPGADEFVTWDAEALQWNWPRAASATPKLRLLQSTTGSDGCALVRVVPSELLELNASGPLHCPLTRTLTFAQEAEPLRVVVSVGAAIDGRIEPAGFVGRIAAFGRNGAPPTVQLMQEDGADWRRYPDKPVPLAADGRFRVEHVPPGTWQVVTLAWFTNAGSSSSLQMVLPLGPPVALAEGECRELPLDARPSMPCTLRGRVLVNGAPWSRGVQLRLEPDLPMLHRRGGPIGFGVGTDADGVFTLTRLPARVRVLVDGIEAPQICRVAPGSTTEATFTITWGTLTLQFVDANDRPVAGALGLLLGPGDAQRQIAADADGRLQLHVPPGALAVGVLPAVLRDQTAMQAFEKQHRDRLEALRNAAAGTVRGEVAAGGELPLRIVVPEAAGY